jgi:hypothetical protein
LSFLNTTAQHGVDLADLPAALRKQFSERDGDMAQQAEQKVVKQWLPLCCACSLDSKPVQCGCIIAP